MQPLTIHTSALALPAHTAAVAAKYHATDPTDHGSNLGVVSGLAVGIFVLIGLLAFLLTRRGRRIPRRTISGGSTVPGQTRTSTPRPSPESQANGSSPARAAVPERAPVPEPAPEPAAKPASGADRAGRDGERTET